MKIKIGLETHVQLNLKSKAFCGCKNPSNISGVSKQSSGDSEPNSYVCEICMGFPGSKPRLNKGIVEAGRKIALTLGCKINKEMYFSRKTYFYPDNPKNFQITQYETPLGVGGELKIFSEGKEKPIRIKRVHLEEDAAKTTHIGGMVGGKYTLIDYNRSGVPVVEIVTEPDIETSAEARAFIQKLINILEYLEVYNSDSRAVIKSDANISIEGGSRVEVKEITGAKEVEEAINFEIVRQNNLIKTGKVPAEVRTWNPETKSTHFVRSKEVEEEYGYIFEPDLPYIENEKSQLEVVKKNLPELPEQKISRFVKEYKINKDVAEAIVSEKELTNLFENAAKKINNDIAATWIAGYLKKTLNWNNLKYKNSGLKDEWIFEILEDFEKGRITDKNGELTIRKMVEEKKSAKEIIKKYNLGKADIDLKSVLKKVLDANKQAVSDFKKGEKKALEFLVGQVMRETRGQVDATEIRKNLEKELS